MIVVLKATKEQKHAILSRYPSVKSFLQRTLSATADQLIADNQIENIEEELKEYHNRKVLNGYDIHRRKHTEETKQKISKTLREKYRGKEHHLSEETKEAIRVGNTGKIVSQATRDLLSVANTGKKRTLAQRERMSLGHKGIKFEGRKLSEEHKRKIGLAHKGMKYKKRVKVKEIVECVV